MNNKNDLEVLIKKEDPNAIMLSETHVTEDIAETELYLKSYTAINCSSNSRHTGGVLFYLKKGLKYIVINSSTLSKAIWLLAIKVWINDFPWTLVVIYRSPNSQVSEFKIFFEQWCNEFLENENNILIAGDFNIDLLKIGSEQTAISNLVTDQGLKQLVKEPTRITNNSRTLIDYVITNVDNNNVSVNIKQKYKISDHETIKIEIKLKNNINRPAKVVKIFKFDKTVFKNLLEMEEFERLYLEQDLARGSLKFKDKLNTCVEAMSYNKSIRCNNEKCGWYSGDLESLRREKNSIYVRAVYEGDARLWEEYKTLRNAYKNKLTKAKDNFIKNKITSNLGDQKGIWRAVKDLVLDCKSQDAISMVEFHGEKVMCPIKIANKFNEYFVNSVSEINSTIPHVPFSLNIAQTGSRFSFRFCAEFDLYSLITKMNTKKDCFGLNSEMIYQEIETIGPVLMHFINLSLENGVFPQQWKETIVVPIEKVKNTKKCEEFRPINMLPIYEKILETFVADQLKIYMEEKNILAREQSGFRLGHSCETALNWIIYDWKKMIDRGEVVIAVFLDFKRAFETLDRRILLEKLRAYGIEGKALKWFETYLTGRTQRTRVNGVLSQAVAVELGVPQGSVLGVLLFLLYVNDIGSSIKHSKVALFADDTLIYIGGRDMDEIVLKLNEDLQSLNVWLQMNKLKLNVNKTKCMIINSTESATVIMDNQPLECVTNFKYLGVILDNKLKFNPHAENVCAKISKKLGFLRRIRNKLTMSTTIMLYNALVLPHFNYCSTLLLACKAETKHRLQVIQNKAMRIILRCNIYTPRLSMLQILKWQSVEQRLIYNAMIFVFKIKNNIAPQYLQSTLTVNESQPYALRGGSNFRLDKLLKTGSQSSVMYKGLKLFNSMPKEIKEEKRIIIFKKKLAEFCKIL